MSGTVQGGKAAAKTNMERQGEDFYRRIGSKGGKTTSDKPKGFAYSAAHGLTWHKTAGQKGGTISRRRKPSQGEIVTVSPAHARHWYDNIMRRK